MNTANNDDIVVDETEEPKARAVATADLDEAESDEKILPRGAVRNEDGSVTISLDYPKSISIRASTGAVRQETFSELTFHRLTGADLNAFRSTAPEHQTVMLFTRATRTKHTVMSALFAKLDTADITRCSKVLDTFF